MSHRIVLSTREASCPVQWMSDLRWAWRRLLLLPNAFVQGLRLIFEQRPHHLGRSLAAGKDRRGRADRVSDFPDGCR